MKPLPHRIHKISSSDYGEAAATLSSCCPSIDESEFILSLLEGEPHGSVAKSRQGALGFVLVSHDIKETVFPKTKSTRKEVSLLDDAGHQDENVMILQGIYVDPRFRRHGLGKELFVSLQSFYPKTTWLALVEENNETARAFFTACGFLDLGLYPAAERGEKPHAFVLKYRPFGLCREAKW